MRALLSVSDKNGIVEFSSALVEMKWELLASRGTAQKLQEAGLPVLDIATVVGSPILGHRVVTLSREVHAMLLSRDTAEDEAELAALGLSRIDLVCVDLYPLTRTIAEGGSYEAVIEQTDIGGPTMLRSAAKGGRIVIANPFDRDLVLSWLRAGRPNEVRFRRSLAAKAELVVAHYAYESARYLAAARDWPDLLASRLAQQLL